MDRKLRRSCGRHSKMIYGSTLNNSIKAEEEHGNWVKEERRRNLIAELFKLICLRRSNKAQRQPETAVETEKSFYQFFHKIDAKINKIKIRAFGNINIESGMI